MNRIKLTVALVLCTAGSLFAQTRYIDELFTTVNIQKDLKYGIGPITSSSSTDLFCDIYSPVGDVATDRACIIIAHAGSFQPDYGSKEEDYIKDFSNKMAKRGFVVMAINYRLGWNVVNGSKEQNSRAVLPAVWRAIQDYRTAIRFLKSNVDQGGNTLGINSNLLIGGGFGAGAYLPVNGMLLDDPSELFIPELRQKSLITGQPTAVPYIDSTLYDLGGIYDTKGGHAGYEARIDMILNYSGAIPTPAVFDIGRPCPRLISTHSDQDEATPYGFATVRALGLIDIIDVYGSFSLHNELKNRNQNLLWQTENRDGYPQKMITHDSQGPFNMYQRGLYTFIGKTYMWSNPGDPYTNSDYATQYRTEMDTLVNFSAYRIEKWLREEKGVGIKEISYLANNGLVSIFPNPAKSSLNLKSTETGKLIREVEFFDINGRLVKSSIVINGDARINIEGMTAGVYTLKIYFDDSIVSDKIVIE